MCQCQYRHLTGKFTEFEARAVASDRLISQRTERIELQQQTIVNLSESVKKAKLEEIQPKKPMKQLSIVYKRL